MSAEADFTIVPWTPKSPQFPAVLALFHRVWPERDSDSGGIEAQIRRHATYPDFKGIAALAPSDELVGLAYGTADRPGMWWHEHIASVLGPEATARYLTGSFAVTELAVAPEWRRRGLGARLMRELLAGLPHEHATLSTERHNAAARALYERLGFSYIVESMVFTPGDVPYVIMFRPLSL
jgi:ribosomal protein S18 acetylase RimI-like enzyme